MYIQNIKNNKNFNENFENAILVGSSGDLLGKNKGEFINTFPLIIRMNDSPTIDFEKDVGNRTDIRIVNFKALNTITKLNPKEFINTKHIILYTNSFLLNHYTSVNSIINVKSMVSDKERYISSSQNVQRALK